MNDSGHHPTLLFWCQHSLGLGHLVRSLALADGLSQYFRVVLLNGGPLPERMAIPADVEVVNLPPLGHDDGYELISRDAAFTPDEARAERRRLIMDTYHRVQPAAVLIELFPFGRKKFADELMPLLDAIHHEGSTTRPRVICSLRDILVGERRDQARHDERASQLVNEYFDLVLVHADHRFARLDESFRPVTPLQVPVVHTGFVTNDHRRPQRGGRLPRVIVSAGGGIVGEPLMERAAAASADLFTATGLSTTIVAGPFLPADVFVRLAALADGHEHLQVIRQVSDLCGEINRSAVSVSQCGYNTAMDLLRADTPAMVVPYSEGREDEQRRRAERLQRLGLVDVMSSDDLTAGGEHEANKRWIARLRAARSLAPARLTLDLDGRRRSAAEVHQLVSSTLVMQGAAS